MNATETRLQELHNTLGEYIIECMADDLWEYYKTSIIELREEGEMTEEEGKILRKRFQGGKVSLNLPFTNNEEQN